MFEFGMRNNFKDFSVMMKLLLISGFIKIKLSVQSEFKIRNIKIPFLHLSFISNGSPNFFNRCVNPLLNDYIIVHSLSVLIVKHFFITLKLNQFYQQYNKHDKYLPDQLRNAQSSTSSPKKPSSSRKSSSSLRCL